MVRSDTHHAAAVAIAQLCAKSYKPDLVLLCLRRQEPIVDNALIIFKLLSPFEGV